MILFVAAGSVFGSQKVTSYYVRDRLGWDKHVAELLAEDIAAFSRLY